MHPNIRSHWIIESDTAAEQEAKEAGYAMHFEIVAPIDDQQLNFWAENGSKNINDFDWRSACIFHGWILQ